VSGRGFRARLLSHQPLRTDRTGTRTAVHIAAVLEIQNHLLPQVRSLQQAIGAKVDQWHDVVKIGHTHLEDAVPLTRTAPMRAATDIGL
jgi:fumarate hydratase class II